MNWVEIWDKYHEEIFVALSALAVSYILSRWIQDHYYLLEYLFIIILFGLIHEIWNHFQTDDTIQGFIEIFGLDSRLMMQVALLWFIGAAVFISITLRDMVESFFGPLSVVQMLAVIVILSRAFVNAYTSERPLSFIDGYRDTYATYTAGILAFLISWYIQDLYPVTTLEHNIASIFPAIFLPWILFYHTEYGQNLPAFNEAGLEN